ncbi:MAG TPA: sugar ABC transporter ATP-binding protein [Solirubrobacteraceae bacterium]|jgi:ABC-type sugar transport system ATPase subunit|nr:sugar ABC transporter ATP-binding protein [Solirubrobacteraceae bacterium]
MADSQAQAGAASVGSVIDAPLLEAQTIYKQFGAVRALRGASLAVSRPGVVHALLGANGSGKSTMLGILSGQQRPDRGVLNCQGRLVSFAEPADAVRAGIAMVSQETSLAMDLTVAENVLLGRLARTAVGIDWKASRTRAASVLEPLGVDYDLDAPVRSLLPHERQMVEIARALSIDARLLILDEPTSSLVATEVDALLNTVRRLSETGVSVIFVSHRLSEVMAVADEVTVLRDGQTAATGAISEFDAGGLIAAMLGNAAPEATAGRRIAPSASQQKPALALSNVAIAGLVNGVSLTVDQGEIVGLAGLEGAGRSELLEAIFGARSDWTGEVQIGEKALRQHSPRTAIAQGIAFVPPDRGTQGLVTTMSVGENLRMVATRNGGALMPPGTDDPDGEIAEMVRRLRIRTPSLDAPVGTLSGGNQQKVALAKWLRSQPRVLLLDEPTRGVDVGARGEIHDTLREAVGRSGLAILVSSSENDELLELCDRIIVMFAGRIVDSINAHEATEVLIAHRASGF